MIRLIKNDYISTDGVIYFVCLDKEFESFEMQMQPGKNEVFQEPMLKENLKEYFKTASLVKYRPFQ
jgi:hypothetical protein